MIVKERQKSKDEDEDVKLETQWKQWQELKKESKGTVLKFNKNSKESKRAKAIKDISFAKESRKTKAFAKDLKDLESELEANCCESCLFTGLDVPKLVLKEPLSDMMPSEVRPKMKCKEIAETKVTNVLDKSTVDQGVSRPSSGMKRVLNGFSGLLEGLNAFSSGKIGMNEIEEHENMVDTKSKQDKVKEYMDMDDITWTEKVRQEIDEVV